jgi:hypothetical protein
MRRVILVLAFVTVILESAWLILGPPDVGGALALFGSEVPTLIAGQAIMVLIAWTAIVVAVGALLLSMTHTIGRSRLAQPPAARASILLAAGLMLLVVSVVQHSVTLTPLCCGSGPAAIREAIHLAQ